MKLYKALFNSIDEIRLLLSSAGLVEGTTLTAEQLKTTRKVLFWHIALRSEEASKKQTYATFDVLSIEPRDRGDGRVLTYKVNFQLTLFTNKEDIRSLIEEINQKAEESGWSFDLASGIEYEHTSRVFTYTFRLGKVVAYGN